MTKKNPRPESAKGKSAAARGALPEEVKGELSPGFVASPEHDKAPASTTEGEAISGPGNGRITR